MAKSAAEKGRVRGGASSKVRPSSVMPHVAILLFLVVFFGFGSSLFRFVLVRFVLILIRLCFDFGSFLFWFVFGFGSFCFVLLCFALFCFVLL